MAKTAKSRRRALPFFLVLGVLAVAASGIGGYTIFGKNADFLSNPSATKGLPQCGASNLFTNTPMTLAQVPSLTPMGNINAPGGHVFLSDHAGMSVYKKDGSTRPGPGDTVATNLYAPGKVHVIGVRKTEYSRGGSVGSIDYGIAFSNCKGRTFYYNHVHMLSDPLAAAVQRSKGICSRESGGGTNMRECSFHVNMVAGAGELLGVVGGAPNTAGIDFGAFDTNLPALAFIHTKRLPERTLYAQCALDYFTGPVKDALYGKLSRTVAPRCGEVMQDKLGTIQGNWYATGKQEFNWDSQLAILHDTSSVEYAVISIGGTVASAREVGFKPQTQGMVNLEPSQVVPGPQVYCYQADPAYEGQGETGGSIRLQLVDSRTLKVEHVAAPCGAGQGLQQPTTYVR